MRKFDLDRRIGCNWTVASMGPTDVRVLRASGTFDRDNTRRIALASRSCCSVAAAGTVRTVHPARAAARATAFGTDRLGRLGTGRGTAQADQGPTRTAVESGGGDEELSNSARLSTRTGCHRAQGPKR